MTHWLCLVQSLTVLVGTAAVRGLPAHRPCPLVPSADRNPRPPLRFRGTWQESALRVAETRTTVIHQRGATVSWPGSAVCCPAGALPASWADQECSCLSCSLSSVPGAKARGLERTPGPAAGRNKHAHSRRGFPGDRDAFVLPSACARRACYLAESVVAVTSPSTQRSPQRRNGTKAFLVSQDHFERG